MRAIPLRRQIIVRLLPAEEKHASGLWKPTKVEPTAWAEVVGVGNEAWLVKEGDVVLVSIAQGTELGMPNELLLPETAVLATKV